MASVKIRKYGDSVYIIYSHKNQKFKIFSGARVEDRYWNLSAPKKNCPDYNNVIHQIIATETRVLNASMKIRGMGIEPLVEIVRKEFYEQVTEIEEEKPFWDLYREYIKTRSFKVSTKQKAEVYKKNLEHYCTWSGYAFHIDSWSDLEFGRFVQYLLFQQKMADSTINRTVRGIKTFLKFAYPSNNLTWMKYNMKPTDEEVVALTEAELRNLIDADLGGYLEKTRDLFIFLATTGMRFSDSQLFQPFWVTKEQIMEFSQLKTGGKAFPPLYEASRRILIKFGGIPPQISNQKFNDYLKELFVELKLHRPIVTHIVKNKVVYQSVSPLSSVISSHAGRRTFITMCLMKGMPIQDVMKMSGHSDYKSMKPYIRVTREHLRTVADKWVI